MVVFLTLNLLIVYGILFCVSFALMHMMNELEKIQSRLNTLEDKMIEIMFTEFDKQTVEQVKRKNGRS